MTVSGLSEPEAAVDHPGVIAQPPRLFAATLALGFALEYFVPTTFVHGPVRVALGAGLIGAGLWLAYTAIREQRAAGTNIEVDRPSECIVSSGLYRFSRNPIYLGLFTLYVGAAVLGDSLWVLGLVAPLFAVMRIGVVAREERYLTKKFGAAYTQYRARVRRWV